MATKTYILAPDWYPRYPRDSDPVITLGTVYSHPLLTKDAKRWAGKDDFGGPGTLNFDAENAGTVRFQDDADWEVDGWVNFLQALKISVGASGSEVTAVVLKWKTLQKMEIHPNLDLAVYANNLVKRDPRTVNGKTMWETMRLGHRRKESLWMVSGLQFATGLEIWVEQRSKHHKQAKAEGNDPHTGVGAGVGVSQGVGSEFYCHRRLDEKAEVLLACQVHEIQPIAIFSDKIATRLNKTGVVLEDPQLSGPSDDAKRAAEEKDLVSMIETTTAVLPKVPQVFNFNA